MTFVDAWSDAIVRASWQGAIVIALAWLVTRAFPKLPPAWRCWLWRGACAKILVSLLWAGAVAIPLLPAPIVTQPTPAIVQPEPPGPPGPTLPAIAVAQMPASNAPGVTISVLLLALWCAGVLGSVIQLVRGHARAMALRRRGVEIPDVCIVDACEDLCRRMRVAHRPALYASSDIRSPLLVGVRRPAIVLPPGALEPPTEVGGPAARGDDSRAARERLRMMLAHELAHLKRRDLLWNWLPALAQALFFFHPLAWLASRELRVAQESACDALALAATGAAPARYGDMLLDVIAAVRAPLRLPRTSSVTIVESRTTVQRRLAAMTHYRPLPPTRRSRALAAAALCFCVLAVVPWKLVAQAPTGPGNAAADAKAATTAEPAKPDATGSPATGAPGAGYPGALFATPGDVNRVSYGQVTVPEVNLGLASEGVVVEVKVEDGQSVKKGDVLLRLDDRRLRIELEKAMAHLEVAKGDLVRVVEEDRNVGRVAQAKVRAAEADVQLAEHSLESTRLVAPFDGVVTELSARPGMIVTRNTRFARLLDLDSLTFDAAVDPAVVRRLRVGGKGKVQLRGEDKLFEATIAYISATIDPATSSARVKARLKAARGEASPGEAGWITFDVEEKK